MLLWLTDSSARREIAYDSSARLPQAEAERLRTELVSAGRPTTCTVIERGADAVLAILAGMDSTAVAGGRCWLRCALGGGGAVTGMELSAEEDAYDVRQHLLRAETLMRDLSFAGTTESGGRSRLRCLPQYDYPDLAALRAALREEFTAQAAEQILQQRGYFMRDGSVYAPDAPWRHAPPWDVTDIVVAARSDRGFTARVSFPLEADRADVDVPLVITLDGWRLDAPLGK
jgi:hypothetical protein